MKYKNLIIKTKIFKNNYNCKFSLNNNKKTASCLLELCFSVKEKINAFIKILKNVYKRKELQGWR